MDSNVSFQNTKKAFLMKDDDDLKGSLRLFKLFRSPLLVKIGSKLTLFALKIKLPLKGLIKKTIFKQFCAGETINETQAVVKDLSKFKVGAILDYSAEGAGREEDFQRTTDELIKIIAVAAGNRSIPYTCLKVSGIASHRLLESLNDIALIPYEFEKEYALAYERLDRICKTAQQNNVPLYIDAEESWIQSTIDRMTEEMMWKYNTASAIVNTTLQMYRHDRVAYLKQLIAKERKNKCFLGVKVVRGAYIEKENKRAGERNYPTPIHPDKTSTDKDFNTAIDICLENIDIVTLCAGTHNEESTMYLIHKMKELKLENDDKRVYSSQLFGMSDHISFNLADAGYNVTKYLPYGPVNTVLPYLIRRAEENSGIAGQMSRELRLLNEEKNRRIQTRLLSASQN